MASKPPPPLPSPTATDENQGFNFYLLIIIDRTILPILLFTFNNIFFAFCFFILYEIRVHDYRFISLSVALFV